MGVFFLSKIKKSSKQLKKEQIQYNRFLSNESKIAENGLRKIKKVGKKILYLCNKCNTTFLCKRRSITRSPICRNCMRCASFGEEITTKILVENKVRFEKEKTFSGLKGQGGGRLRFDYYIFNTHGENFIIEIDGEQHRGSEWSPSTIANDKIKDDFCKNKNINLYRIKYKFGKLQKLANEVSELLFKKGFDIKQINIGNSIKNPIAENIKKKQGLSTIIENTIDIPPISQYLDEVNLFVRGYCNTVNSDRLGMFVAILAKGSFQKIIYGTNKNTTTNRMIISGIIEAVKMLKRPCKINLFTHTLIGLKSKGSNKDLIYQLLNLITNNHHILSETVSQERQKELQAMLSLKLKNEKLLKK